MNPYDMAPRSQVQSPPAARDGLSQGMAIHMTIHLEIAGTDVTHRYSMPMADTPADMLAHIDALVLAPARALLRTILEQKQAQLRYVLQETAPEE